MRIEAAISQMIAAIYARKSTEQIGLADEAKSVTRQVEHATAYALKKGWTVAEAHVYTDDGISGAEFVKRPGLARMMNTISSRPFQGLMMSEESRLGREQIETAYVLKQITDAGVRVFFYLEDRERTLDSAMDKVMLSLTNFAAEMEREKASQRTYDAMARKARALHVTGGKVYGYDNLEVLATDGTRQHVLRRINTAQASVIRRIFQMVVGGRRFTRIAKTLNSEGVTPPRGRGGWAPSAIREMVYRPLYQGRVVWNRSQKITRGGTKKQRKRPQREWLTLDAPDLRIIPEDVWQAAHQRLEQTRSLFARARAGGHLLGRPSRLDLESPYLLSGMGRALWRGSDCDDPRARQEAGETLWVRVPLQARRDGLHEQSSDHSRPTGQGSRLCSRGGPRRTPDRGRRRSGAGTVPGGPRSLP